MKDTMLESLSIVLLCAIMGKNLEKAQKIRR